MRENGAMRICVPSGSNKGLHEKVHLHFGSAPFFIVYDTGTKHHEIVCNKNSEHAHGMCQPLSAIQDLDIDVVVCGGMGARAVGKLNEAGIKVFRSDPVEIKNMIDKFTNIKLEELSAENACKHHDHH